MPGKTLQSDDIRIIDAFCLDLVSAIATFETIERQFDPGIVDHLREMLRAPSKRLEHSRASLQPLSRRRGFEALHRHLDGAAGDALDGIRTFSEPAGLEESLIHFRKAKRKIGRSQEVLFQLRQFFPSVNRFFLEPPVHDHIKDLDGEASPDNPVGLFHLGRDDTPYARGSASLYVPESYDHSRAWPVVVALHGGFGHGRDFIWTWLREARSRRFILVAPTSQEMTWSITGTDVDSPLLKNILDFIMSRWNVDIEKILLTGLSDGATYLLARALDEKTPFTAFAPVAGVLPPFDFRHVRGRRIYWVHGSYDWMFPADRARQDCDLLSRAGADITLKVIDGLSHTYPRDQNDGILTWFCPSLALPQRGDER
jgi:phospholipase/carboxylesterase